MLSNAYFLAKFRFDTAENEPAKNVQTFSKNLQMFKQVRDRLGLLSSFPRAKAEAERAEEERHWARCDYDPNGFSEGKSSTLCLILIQS